MNSPGVLLVDVSASVSSSLRFVGKVGLAAFMLDSRIKSLIIRFWESNLKMLKVNKINFVSFTTEKYCSNKDQKLHFRWRNIFVINIFIGHFLKMESRA